MRRLIPGLVILGGLAFAGPAGALVAPDAVRLGGRGEEFAASVKVARDGSVYVLGTTESKSVAGRRVDGESDMVLAKFTADSKLIWLRLLGA